MSTAGTWAENRTAAGIEADSGEVVAVGLAALGRHLWTETSPDPAVFVRIVERLRSHPDLVRVAVSTIAFTPTIEDVTDLEEILFVRSIYQEMLDRGSFDEPPVPTSWLEDLDEEIDDLLERFPEHEVHRPERVPSSHRWWGQVTD